LHADLFIKDCNELPLFTFSFRGFKIFIDDQTNKFLPIPNQLTKTGISPVFNPHIPMTTKTEHNKIIFIAARGICIVLFLSIMRTLVINPR